MVVWLVLALTVSAGEPNGVPCAVEFSTASLESAAPFDAWAAAQRLARELGRPVAAAPARGCDSVTVTIDLGVITVSVQRQDKPPVRRAVTRGPDELAQVVLAAANVLRDPLAEHLADHPPRPPTVPSAVPPSPTPTAPPPTVPSSFWGELNAVGGVSYQGIVVVGVDANVAWRRTWLQVGLSFVHSSALLPNRYSTRFTVMPEAGFIGSLSRFRLGLLMGVGPLVIREIDSGVEGYFVVPEYRLRLMLGAAVTDEFEVLADVGYGHAPAETRQYGLLFANLGFRFRFAQW